MKKILKTKVVALIVGTGLLIISCGTSNDVVSGGMFSKRKYTKGYHTNFRQAIHSNDQHTLAKNLNGNNSDENQSISKADVSNDFVDKKSSLEQNNIISPSAVDEENGFEKVAVKESANDILSTFSTEGRKNVVNKVTDEKKTKHERSVYSLKKEAKKMAPSSGGDSKIIHIILIIILVLLIISLLSFIGGPLGGLLSLAVLILLILIILSALGVI